MSLRKEKAARLKLSVLEHTLKLIGKKSFDSIFVDEICAKTKISKVTLFKYFPQKEDILLYYFRVWCLHRAVDLNEKPKEGMAGITYLFDKLSEECESHPGMILSLFGYLADLRRPPKPFPVKLEERQLLYPNKENISSIDIQSVDQMFEKFTLEAIFKKEITKTTSTKDITNLFTTVFYGSVLTAHVLQMSNLKFFFRKNVELIAKGF
ncbi:MAG TPA: TetR/AcrR family transcriptional regulator [Cyclobacteriaceae bacterium]|mgnify:FL=1|nr:TetR/AcrR family transcriptional regulator [Cyclobacteriaceae bacterium]HRK54902.1 TetR/AcrR family transcriptional regulator [Cyclobacteriaceae bacterium]